MSEEAANATKAVVGAKVSNTLEATLLMRPSAIRNSHVDRLMLVLWFYYRNRTSCNHQSRYLIHHRIQLRPAHGSGL